MNTCDPVNHAELRTELQALELRLRAELEQRLNRQTMQLAMLFVAALGVAVAILKWIPLARLTRLAQFSLSDRRRLQICATYHLYTAHANVVVRMVILQAAGALKVFSQTAQFLKAFEAEACNRNITPPPSSFSIR